MLWLLSVYACDLFIQHSGSKTLLVWPDQDRITRKKRRTEHSDKLESGHK